MLKLFKLPADIPMIKLKSLKELRIGIPPLNFCKLVATNFINLTRIYFGCNIDYNDICELVSYAPKIEDILFEAVELVRRAELTLVDLLFCEYYSVCNYLKEGHIKII